MLNDLIDWLIDQGRMGAVWAGGVALVCFGAAAAEWHFLGLVHFILPALGGAFVFLALLLAVLGRGSRVDFTIGAPGQLDQAVLDRVENTPYPFEFCTRCLVLCSLGACPECVRTTDVMEVRDDEDKKVLLAAIGA